MSIMNRADTNVLIYFLRCISVDVHIGVEWLGLFLFFFFFFYLEREVLFRDMTAPGRTQQDPQSLTSKGFHL